MMTDPKFDPEFLDRVVREVIRRLQDQGLTVQTNGQSTTGELVLQERLVTRVTLDGRLSGISRVVIGRKAVVTPAVRDDLKDQKIELVRR